MHPYPASIAIQPLAAPPVATVTVPGSKSITNRALVLAALCSRNGPCTLTGMLRSDDTEVMLDCLTKLGFRISTDWTTNTVTVHKNESDRIIPATSADLFVGNSGTTVRFLAAMLALGDGRYLLDGVPRMRERPIQDLLDALQQLGVKAVSESGTGCPPVVIETTGIHGPGAVIRGETSSQFVSALLMVSPLQDRGCLGFGIQITGEAVSEPYIRMTEAMMLQWGSTWRYDHQQRGYSFDFDSQAHYFSPPEYPIEPDASSASYFFAAAAIMGGEITVHGMKRDMLQGDVKFVDCLQQMGCTVTELADGIRVRGGPLHGIDVDMNAIMDSMVTIIRQANGL